MRRSASLLLAVSLLLAGPLFAGNPSADKAKSDLNKYFTACPENVPPDGTHILTFDHLLRVWHGFTWDRGLLGDDSKLHFKELDTASPTVEVSEAGLRVYVVNTNPLVFSTVQTAATTVQRPDIAALKDAALAIGRVLTAGITAGAQRAAIIERAPAPSWSSPRPPAPSPFDRTESVQRRTTPPDVTAAALQVQKDADNSVAGLKKAEEDLDKSGTKVVDAIDNVKRSFQATVADAQLLEDGAPGKLSGYKDPPLTVAQMSDLYTDFEAKAAVVTSTHVPCAAAYRIIADRIALEVNGFGEKEPDQSTARDTWDDLMTRLDKAIDVCDGENSGYADHLKELETWLSTNNPDVKPMPAGLNRSALVKLRATLLNLAGVVKVQDDLPTDLAKVIDLKATTLASTVRVHLIHTIFSTTCGQASLANGVIAVDRNIDTTLHLGGTKNGTETFKIVADADIAGLKLRRATDLQKTYSTTTSLKDRWDVDVALTYTKLYESTFEVVDNPNPKVPPDPDMPDVKLIKESKRSTRAGQVAALVTFRTDWSDHFRPQFGASLSTDKPGLFAGIAWVPHPYFKISGGWTLQKVAKLTNHQHVGDVGDAKLAIQTRDGFADRWYLAISITLDNIPFFAKP